MTNGPDGETSVSQGAACHPDARSPAPPPVPSREAEGAFLCLALVAFCCAVLPLRVHALTPGQDSEVSSPSPCQLSSSPAAPSYCCHHRHGAQSLFPGQGWHVSWTFPGWLSSAPADGHCWPLSVEETSDGPRRWSACVWGHHWAKVRGVLGALSAGACTCHDCVLWEVQKSALWGHPRGALSNGGTNKEGVSGARVNGGSRPDSEQADERAWYKVLKMQAKHDERKNNNRDR